MLTSTGNYCICVFSPFSSFTVDLIMHGFTRAKRCKRIWKRERESEREREREKKRGSPFPPLTEQKTSRHQLLRLEILNSSLRRCHQHQSQSSLLNEGSLRGQKPYGDDFTGKMGKLANHPQSKHGKTLLLWQVTDCFVYFRTRVYHLLHLNILLRFCRLPV